MKKAYLDTNVLVYRLLPSNNSRLQRGARDILDKCRSGTHLGIISNLTLTEFAGVCQKMETYDIVRIGPMNDIQRETHIQTEGLANYNRVIPHFLSLPHIKLEETSNLKFSDIISDSLEVMQETIGTIKIPRARPGEQIKAEFRRAYVADILHLLLAKHVGCDEFYTFDKDIKKLQSHQKFDSIKIMTY